MAAGAEGSSAADAAVPTRTHYSGLYVNVACLLCAVSLCFRAQTPSTLQMGWRGKTCRRYGARCACQSNQVVALALPRCVCCPFVTPLFLGQTFSLHMPPFPAFCLQSCMHIDIDMFTHMHTCTSLRTCVLQDQGLLPSVQDFSTTPETFLVL